MRRRLLPVLAAAAALVSACARAGGPAPSEPPSGPWKITVVGLNDFHGAIEERRVLLRTSGGTTAEVRVGGAAMLAAYLKRLDAADPEGTLILNGGDMWQGSLESNHFEGRPVVMLDNAIGTDAAALGNHEFDYGPQGAASIPHPDDPPDLRYGALIERQKEAQFPILAANVRPVEEGMFSWQAWVMLERKGLRIAIVGLATEDTPNTTQRPNVAGLAFDPPGPALRTAAEEARAAGADLVLVVAHLGGACERGTAPTDPDACREGSEVEQVLASLPMRTGRDGKPRPLVDAFVAGHTHQYMSHFVRGVPVVESGAYGVAFGRVELEIDRATREVVRTEILPPEPVCRDVLAATGSCLPPAPGEDPGPATRPASFLGGNIEPDPEVDRLLAPFRQEVATLKGRVIAQAARPLGVARHAPSEMGALVTDEMLAATRRLPEVPDADFALQNTGGIRKPLDAGPLTYGGLYEVLPFDNYLTTMTLTGAQLERLVTGILRTGRVPQGAGMQIQPCGKGEAISARIIDARNGRRIDPKRNYVVVWNDFLANGGDGTKDALDGITNTVHGVLLRDAVADGLALRKTPLNAESEPVLDPKKPRLLPCR